MPRHIDRSGVRRIPVSAQCACALALAAAALSPPAAAQLVFSTETAPVPVAAAPFGAMTSGDLDGDGLFDVVVLRGTEQCAAFGAGRYGGMVTLSNDTSAVSVLQNHASSVGWPGFSITTGGELHKLVFAPGTQISSQLEVGTWLNGQAQGLATWSLSGSALGFVVVRDTSDVFHPSLYTQSGAYHSAFSLFSVGLVGAAGLADFDGNAIPSIVAFNNNNGMLTKRPLEGGGAAVSAAPFLDGLPCMLRHSGQAVEQMVWVAWDESTNKARLHLMDDPSFAVGIEVADAPVVGIASGDLDDDGLADVVMTLENEVRVVTYGSGPAFTSPPTVLPNGSGPSPPVVRDLDGDGDTDIYVACGSAAAGFQGPVAIIHRNQQVEESKTTAEFMDAEHLSAVGGEGEILKLWIDQPDLELGASHVQIIAWEGTALDLDTAEFEIESAGHWRGLIPGGPIPPGTWPARQSLAVPLGSWPDDLGVTDLFFIEVRFVIYDEATMETQAVHPSVFYAGIRDKFKNEDDYQALLDHDFFVYEVDTRGRITPGIIHTSGRPDPIGPYPQVGPLTADITPYFEAPPP